MVRRRFVLVAVLVVAVAIAAFGIASPLWVKSPQQLAAEAAPPSPSVVTAPVEQRVVTQTVVLRGVVTSRQVFEVVTATSGEGAPPVVTEVRVQQGDEVHAGEVILEVSGRPVVALPGQSPAYRDLRPGAQGEDIAQLQRAMRRLGYVLDETDGSFGPATKRAVEAFYEDRGYTAATTGEGDKAAFDAAEAEVTQLERQVEDAEDALQDAATPDEREQAQKSMDRAKEDLNAARERLAELRSRTGPMVPLPEIVFLPSFPARVHSLNASLGSRVEAPVVSLASGPLVVEAQASPVQRELLRTGMPVEITIEGENPARGTISSIGELGTESENESEPAAPGHKLVVTPEEPLDGELAAAGARLTVTAVSSGSEVLAVPIAALFASPDGSVYVRARTPAGEERTVVVVAELSGDGYVAVNPVSGALYPGEFVVVGTGDAGGGQ
jgi:peptidoglycan hydrolase-like protein with peptidoglycan-binding domain